MHRNKKRVIPGRKVQNAAATTRVAELPERKKDLVSKVWSNYVNCIPTSVTNAAGYYRLKSTPVLKAHEVANMVQLFVREQRQTRQRTVEKHVMDFLDGFGFITVDRTSKKTLTLHYVQ